MTFLGRAAYHPRMSDDSRITALETAIAELRDEVERLRAGRNRSMRDTLQCPVCGTTRILHFTRIKDLGHNEMVDLALQKQYSLWWGVKLSAAALEAFACRGCRLVEWHAISVDDVQPDGNEVVELDGTQRGAMVPGPYR